MDKRLTNLKVNRGKDTINKGCKMKKTNTHLFFYGSVYSQWVNTPFVLEGHKFANAEQYMMYKKAQHFDDQDSVEKILAEPNPKKVKALGRKVKDFDAESWAEVAEDHVTVGSVAKFTQNEDCLEQMIKDKNLILVEASPYDRIWGIGLGVHDPKCLDEKQWNGTNKLGTCLMRAREIVLPTKEKQIPSRIDAGISDWD